MGHGNGVAVRKRQTSSPESEEYIQGQRVVQDGITHGPLGRLYATTEGGQKWTRRKNGQWEGIDSSGHTAEQGGMKAIIQVPFNLSSQSKASWRAPQTI